MVLLKYTSITKWAEALKANPRLARIAGFEPHDVPAAGSIQTGPIVVEVVVSCQDDILGCSDCARNIIQENAIEIGVTTGRHIAGFDSAV